MKKYVFFKYFIKNRVFAGGVEMGLGDPSLLGAELGVQFLSPIWFGDGSRYMQSGAETKMFKHVSAPLPGLSTNKKIKVVLKTYKLILKYLCVTYFDILI